MSRSPTESALRATAFHEAGHVVAAWRRGLKVYGATIVPAPGIAGKVEHANPLHGIRLEFDGSARARQRAEAAIIVCLAGPEAQRRHRPRSWRSYHGWHDHERAADLASSVNESGEAANAHLKWLEIVTRDELATLWPFVETIAAALVDRQTLTAAEILAEITRRDRAPHSRRSATISAR